MVGCINSLAAFSHFCMRFPTLPTPSRARQTPITKRMAEDMLERNLAPWTIDSYTYGSQRGREAKHVKRNPKQDCLFFALLLVVSTLVSPAVADPPRGPDAGEDPVRDPLRLDNLSRISLALRKFDDKHGHFPQRVTRSEDGRPLLSWRVLILPFLGHEALHAKFRFDQPWDSAHNRQLIREMPDVFDVGVYVDEEHNTAAGYTHVMAPVMEGSLWHGDDHEKRTVVDIQDGSAYTLAVFAAPRDEAVVWTKPADLSMTEDTVGQVMFGRRQFCLITTFDGAKYCIARSSSNADLKSLITIDGREEVVWKNFMPWLPAPRTSNAPRTPRNWSMGLPHNTTDEILAKRLARKPDVTWLTLSHTQVTAAGLRHLHGLPALKSVSLNDAQATDAGLQQLLHVTTLEALDLCEAPVTDAGLKHLAGLTNLKRLVLDHTKISDAGLSHLAGLTALEDLGLANTPVTDAGLAHLRGLTSLKKLRLSGNGPGFGQPPASDQPRAANAGPHSGYRSRTRTPSRHDEAEIAVHGRNASPGWRSETSSRVSRAEVS